MAHWRLKVRRLLGWIQDFYETGQLEAFWWGVIAGLCPATLFLYITLKFV